MVHLEHNFEEMTTIESKTAAETAAARQATGVMQRKSPGYLRVTGRDHVDLLHRLTTNDLRALEPGEGQITVFANEIGRIIDRVHLLKLEDAVHLITSPGNGEKIRTWIDKYIFIEDVQVQDHSDTYGVLSVFGPKSAASLHAVLDCPAEQLRDCAFTQTTWQGNRLLVQRSDELDRSGFNVIVESAVLPALLNTLLANDAGLGVQSMSEQAYEILRIEAGWPVYEQDFDEGINPHEARMWAHVNFDKGCYIGQEVIARLDTYEKVQKHLMGVALDGDTLPRAKAPVRIEDEKVGFITSAAYSYALKTNIALCYVRTKFAQPGNKVMIETEKQVQSGHLHDLPFQTG
ncbi:MAG: aminomethyltransferase family protein [bacterium]